MAGWKFFINDIQVDEPIGFDAIEFNAVRMESHGIDQPFSTEVTWSGTPSRFQSGAKILKSFFDNSFINTAIPFRITSDQVIDGNAYDFNGFINMALYSEKNTCDTQGWEITVGIIENDFKEVFMARQDVEVDLLTLKDLDQNVIPALTFTDVRLHTQELYLLGRGENYSVQTSTIFYDDGSGWKLTDFATMLPIYWRNSDFKGVFGSTKDPTGSSYTDTNACFINNGTSTRTFNFNIAASGRFVWFVGINNDSSADIVFSIQVRNSSGSETQRYYPFRSGVSLCTNPRVPLNWNFDVPFSLTLNPGDRVLMFMQWADGGNVKVGAEPDPDISYSMVVEIATVNVTVNELNSDAFASLCNGLYVFDFLKRLLLIITGNSNALVSDYFSVVNQGLMWNNLITTGLYIRNGQLLDEANPQIPTSFSQFFEDLSRIFNLGWAFEYNESLSIWQIRVEPMEYFYDETVLIGNFEKVSNITQNANVQDLVNSFKLGFTDQWKNIAVSGIFEPHTYRGYSTPNKSRSADVKVLDLRSGILGSGYAIEFSRRLQYLRDDSGSSDRPNDYNLFIIWLNRSSLTITSIQNTLYKLPNETGTVTFAPGKVSVGSDLVGSASAPISEIYNIIHTPARIAARWWKYLGMNTYGLPSAKAKLFFESGEYYTVMTSTVDDAFFPVANQEIPGTVLENTNISPDVIQNSLSKYLFKPISLEFSFPQSLCSFIEMANIGTGFIRITSGGFEFFGYLENATNKPVDPNSGITDFKLILAKNIPDYFSGDYFPGDYFTGD